MSDVEGARRFAAQQVKQWVAFDTPETRMSPGEQLLFRVAGCKFAEGPHGSYIANDVGADKILCNAAMEYEDPRKLMRRIVTSKLLAGAPMTRHEAIFAALCVDGALPEIRKRPGKKRAAMFERNLFIIDMIEEIITRFDLKPTRNAEKKSDRNSACDLISEAFAEAGRHEVTYGAAKDVWHSKLLKRLCGLIRAVVNRKIADEEERVRRFERGEGQGGLLSGMPANALTALKRGATRVE